MSGLNEPAPDPLALLRASDRRPRIEVLRERLFNNGSEALRTAATRIAFVVLVFAFIGGIGWRLFTATEPPVEASIPFAQPGEPVAASVPASSELVVEAAAETNEAPVTVVVHVAGAVYEPGIVVGDSTWRVDDALRAAGGTTPTADLDRINLAALLTDGERVFVPYLDEEVPALVQSDLGGGVAGVGSAVVDLNTSSPGELESLPGVGPATAAAIIAHRDEFGSFASVDALVAVAGIGPATLESLRDLVRV